MTNGQWHFSSPRYLQAVVLAVALGVIPSHSVMGQNECLIEFGDVPDAAKNGGVIRCTDCDPSCDADGVNTANGSCTFKLKACVNEADLGCVATEVKKPVVKGRCGGSTLMAPVASGAAPSCGAESSLTVKLTKKGKRPGKCKITAKALSSGKPRRADKDVLTLVCNPRPAGEACPPALTAPSTTTTSTSTTTTITTTCVTVTTVQSQCQPIVAGQPIQNTYKLQGTTGENRCTTNSASACNGGTRNSLSCTTDDTNATTGCPGTTCPGCCVATRFRTCNTDADCGGTANACMSIPWVTADGQVMPFSTGTQTTFTVTAVGSFPACEHDVCVPCGNPNASCAGIPGCEAKHCQAGSRTGQLCTTDDTSATTGCPGTTCPACCVADNANGCVPRGTQGCCDQPGFIVPTFFVNILGGLCSRVDQIACGGGVVNTSNPQTGDNEVNKNGDTSDPGADCCYNGHPGSECLGGVNLNDDPAPLTCSIIGAGNDYKGKIVRTVGNGTHDADGIQYRLITPELSTTWTDGQSPSGSCADGSTYDDGELLISQLILKAEPTSAGASGSFTDQNGDGCKRAGAGFISGTNPGTDGPIIVPGAPTGPARPQNYAGTQGAVMAAVSEVFSGPNSPIRDIGFVAITPNMPAVVVPPVCCNCTVQPGCPE